MKSMRCPLCLVNYPIQRYSNGNIREHCPECDEVMGPWMEEPNIEWPSVPKPAATAFLRKRKLRAAAERRIEAEVAQLRKWLDAWGTTDGPGWPD